MIDFSRLPEGGFCQKGTQIVPFLFKGHPVDIVFCDQLMGFEHGRFGLILIPALGQGEKFFDSDEYPVIGIFNIVVHRIL